MTTEVRTTIEISDIIAIELRCRGCNGKQTIRLDKWLVSALRCANCGTSWPIQSVNEHQTLLALANTLSQAAKIEKTPDVPFDVRLELKATAKP
jgi:hypothetical protein